MKKYKEIYEDTFYYSIKNGITSNFIVPFALLLGAANDFIGILSTTPQLIGSFVQLFSSDLMKLVKERKYIIALAALIDAVLFLPILLLPFINGNPVILLNFLVMQAIAVELISPIYNSLIGDIVPQKTRGKFFSKINKISGIVSFITSIVAGFFLYIIPNKPIGFAIIFLVALITRLKSSQLRFQYPEKEHLVEKRRISLRKFTKKLNKTNFGHFVLYSSLMKFAVGIASPFFAVYMLNYLKMDFLTYSIVNAASIISSFLVLSRWGKNIDLRGSKWMLGISGMIVPFIPILWIFFTNPLILILLQFISGAAWSAYNLSSNNFVLDATTRRNRLVMTSYNNFFIGVLTFLGAIIGGNLLKYLPADFFGNIFYFVFGLSGVLRLIISLVFLPKIKEERFIDIEIQGPMAKRIISITPQQGIKWVYVPRKKKK